SDEELEELMKDQLLPADASPIALSPDYISDSDPKEDDEEEHLTLADPSAIPTDDPLYTISSCFLRPNPMQAYTVGHREKKHYGGSKPLYFKYNYHYIGSCAPKCHKCNRVGHLTRDCRSSTNASTTINQRGTRNQNHKNGGTRAHGVVHALGGGETNQDHNDMEEDINA
ncbi:hypothetical protein Tco_0193141, partial [Tanacetum coccineum]